MQWGKITDATANDVLAGDGEGALWGQITDATAKGAGTTYKLEVRGSAMGSDRGCDCKGSWDGILAGSGEGVQ